MATDYKRRGGRSRARGSAAGRSAGSGRGGWPWLLAGLSLGLSVAFAVHLYHRDLLLDGALLSPRAAAQPTPGVSAGTPRPARAADRRRRPDPAQGATRFEFYSLLPEMEVVVPDQEVIPRAAPVREGEPRTDPSARYVLQAGAFRSLKDADRLRATLALAGLEAKIQTVSVSGRDTWHRVRLGPYADLSALAHARGQLRAAHIEPMVLKIRT